MVHIILPNTNGEKTLEKCLDSIQNQTYKDFKITFIDNASMDDSVALVTEKFPKVEVITNTENKGIGVVVNNVAVKTNCEYICIVLPDTVVEKTWLESMLKVADADPTIFSVCPVLVYPHNLAVAKQAGYGYTLGGMAFGMYGGKKVAKLKPKRVFAAPMSGALYNKKIFLNLNGYDEHYFNVWQDIDISWRGWRAGYKTILCPESLVYRLGANAEAVDDTYVRLEARNNVWTIYKNLSAWSRFWHGYFINRGREKMLRRYRKNRLHDVYFRGVKEGLQTRKKLIKRFKPKKSFFNSLKINFKRLGYSWRRPFHKRIL
ncbi:MAG: glycosyltransferase family 2 protein [Clostridiales bacterium]|jgi:GT2 family glycosyltransferase|nr:glycosyltransferase family 2 protein [Clostridiales bacterium]